MHGLFFACSADDMAVCVMTRTTTSAPFGSFATVHEFCQTNTTGPAITTCPTFVTDDGLRAYVWTNHDSPPKSAGVFLEQRTTTTSDFAVVFNVAPFANESFAVTHDELKLFTFDSSTSHVVTATRTSASAFGAPVALTGLDEYLPTWISPDECRLYLDYDTAAGSSRLYVASRAQ